MAVDNSDYTHRLERLLEVCKSLSANLDLEPLLQSIIETASELTRSESSSILVYDKATNSLRFAAAPWYQKEALKAVSIPLDRSIAGQVFSQLQPMTLSSFNQSEQVFRIVDRELNSDTHSLLAVPLIFKGSAIGVLESINKLGNIDYTEEDVIILETIASQAAIAIENQRLLNEARFAYQKMIEMDRMKSDFISIASHELRTPLGVILGHATFLEDAANEQDRKELKTIVKSAMHLKDLIEQFANMDQLEHGLSRIQRVRVAIIPLLQELVDAYKDMAKERKINLAMEPCNKNLVVEGDAGKITIVVSNLIKNALTFTNERGHVLVKAEEVPGYVKISVMDNGIGIPIEEQSRIFERFYQVENHLTRRHGGMGLGLSIAKQLIDMHGGKIWVESIEGKGSKFIFLLPQNAAQVSAAQRVFLP
ncbi:MAG TPA: HAMP domain-containing sensor histidine kinase [Anaerolineaceae bacterium]|nr:HAMP domain-containing sensor histidine kinase [Anaerolineaceae bacterium]